ncbi:MULTISPECIES: hypothetical protein [unclassified Amycolatopsis]|uniref:hypothetical protein n=1 Tax=unclassified Amycolatopsis TaxID=2618356 RepID=UPI00106E2A13|nr:MULTISPECIES: hypothetical protein [unclassified Amycolatopsis]
MDGPGFHVDIAAVDEAARGISGSVHDQDGFELRGLCGDAELYGHAGVHDALMEFATRWSDGIDVLTDDASAIGDALGRAVRAYRAIDESATRSLTGDPGVKAVEDG